MNAKDLKRRKRTPTGPATTSRVYSDRVITGIVCIFLAAIVWIAFGRALGNGFVDYDDVEYVYDNPKITSGLSFNGIQWAFTHVHAANWHPLTTISHMLDCQLYGLQPWGHHLTNILLHATGAILLFLALLKLTVGEAVGFPRDANSVPYSQRRRAKGEASSVLATVIDRRYSLWASAFVAALFAIHPLRVESVAWVSERKDVLSGVFFMLTLLAYARYVRKDRHRTGAYLLVIVLFALGLMCKPTLVTLPFVLLLLDYWPLGRMQSGKSEGQRDQRSEVRGRTSEFQRFSFSAFQNVRLLVVEKIPLFLLSAASCVATVLAQKQALEKSLNLTLVERVSNAVVSYVAYLSQMFYPEHLAVLYPYRNLTLAEALVSLLFLGIVSVIFFLWRRRYPFLLVGWLWYLGMLVPMIGLVQVGAQTRADRYTYLPQIGLYILATWGAVELFARWRAGRKILAVAALLVIVALAACTYRDTSYWENSETLWKHAIANTSNNYIAHYNLGVVFLRKAQSAAALVEFQKALQINPDYADVEMNLGVVLQRSGDLDGAIRHTQKALQIDPDSPEALYNLGNLLLQRGHPDEGITYYRKALAIKPDYPEAHTNLGAALAQKGELDQAITEFDEALRLRPKYAEAHTDLGNALSSQRRFDEAIPHYVEALRLNPNSPETHYNLGDTLLQLGRREEAIAHFTEALRLNPDYAEAKRQLRNLGVPLPQ